MLKKIIFLLCICFQLNAVEKVFVLFGPPGAGKGTFAQFIKEKYGYAHLSIGDLVREEIDLQTEIGKEAEEILQKGNFLQESMVQALMLKHIIPFTETNKPFIIDGFPRTEEAVYFIRDLFNQFDLSDQVLLIMLTTDDAICEERVLSRSICKQCSHIYNLISCPPEQNNICDFCFSPLKIRSNDTKEIVRKRLEEYHQVTEKAYRIAKTFFPSIEFDTSVPIKECMENYMQVIDES